MRSKIKTIDDKYINSIVHTIESQEDRIRIVEELLESKYHIDWNKNKLNLNIRNY